MKTVREVFSKAFGEVPEGATCHGFGRVDGGGDEVWQLIRLDGAVHVAYKTLNEKGWINDGFYRDISTSCPDISNRDAEAFRGFFGAEYDAALDQLQETK